MKVKICELHLNINVYSQHFVQITLLQSETGKYYNVIDIILELSTGKVG